MNHYNTSAFPDRIKARQLYPNAIISGIEGRYALVQLCREGYVDLYTDLNEAENAKKYPCSGWVCNPSQHKIVDLES